MRLIDADALKRKSVPLLFPTKMEPCGHIPVPVNAVVVAEIEQAPTIDAVPVVRCENCNHGYPCGDEIVCYHPEYELAEGKWSYKKDFFCAFGETKEGAD